jgi:hypothetical protein
MRGSNTLRSQHTFAVSKIACEAPTGNLRRENNVTHELCANAIYRQAACLADIANCACRDPVLDRKTCRRPVRRQGAHESRRYAL